MGGVFSTDGSLFTEALMLQSGPGLNLSASDPHPIHHVRHPASGGGGGGIQT